MQNHFTDDELNPRVFSIKLGAGQHAALRELAREICTRRDEASLNSLFRTIVDQLIDDHRERLTKRTKELLLLADGSFRRLGQLQQATKCG